MSSSTHSAPVLVGSESAATRVFSVPELVAFILANLSQPELAAVAPLNLACAAESGRVLYRSPSLVHADRLGPRLAGLITALEKRPGSVRTFTLCCKLYTFPKEDLVKKLFRQLDGVTVLELAGMYSRTIPDLRTALQPISAQLVEFSLSFRSGTSSQTAETLGILSACTALRHLGLANLSLKPRFASFCAAPSYSLHRLQLDALESDLGTDDFIWLAGNSSKSLKSLDVFVEPPLAEALDALKSIAPSLQEAYFDVEFRSDEEVDAALRLTKLPQLKLLDIELDNEEYLLARDEWAALQERVQMAIVTLDAKSSSKVHLNVIDHVISDSESDSEDEGSEYEEPVGKRR